MTGVHRKIHAWQSPEPPGWLVPNQKPRYMGGRQPEPVELGLHFDTEDPFEIQAALITRHPTNRSATTGWLVAQGPWRFDRTLLKAALVAAAGVEFGHGDVRIVNVGGSVTFRLATLGNDVTWITCSTTPCAAFIADVDRIVPPDAATYDVDAWLTELFEGGVT